MGHDVVVVVPLKDLLELLEGDVPVPIQIKFSEGQLYLLVIQPVLDHAEHHGECIDVDQFRIIFLQQREERRKVHFVELDRLDQLEQRLRVVVVQVHDVLELLEADFSVQVVVENIEGIFDLLLVGVRLDLLDQKAELKNIHVIFVAGLDRIREQFFEVRVELLAGLGHLFDQLVGQVAVLLQLLLLLRRIRIHLFLSHYYVLSVLDQNISELPEGDFPLAVNIKKLERHLNIQRFQGLVNLPEHVAELEYIDQSIIKLLVVAKHDVDRRFVLVNDADELPDDFLSLQFCVRAAVDRLLKLENVGLKGAVKRVDHFFFCCLVVSPEKFRFFGAVSENCRRSGFAMDSVEVNALVKEPDCAEAGQSAGGAVCVWGTSKKKSIKSILFSAIFILFVQLLIGTLTFSWRGRRKVRLSITSCTKRNYCRLEVAPPFPFRSGSLSTALDTQRITAAKFV